MNNEGFIKGYKCFNKGLTNRYGKKFELLHLYHTDGDIKFGNNGNGFHMCKNMEDTLRYFDAMNDEVDICYVECFGNHDLYEDDYYGYYDMYSVEYLFLTKLMTREDILKYALKLNEPRIIRLVSLYKFTEEELKIIRDAFKNNLHVQDYISYYQCNDKEVFNRRRVRKIERTNY